MRKKKRLTRKVYFLFFFVTETGPVLPLSNRPNSAGSTVSNTEQRPFEENQNVSDVQESERSCREKKKKVSQKNPKTGKTTDCSSEFETCE